MKIASNALILRSDGNIVSNRLDGNGTYLTNDGQMVTGGALNADAAWSFDGSKIVYVRQVAGEHAHIWTMNADGSDKRQVTFDALTGLYPTFSPDGGSILFTHYETDDHFELWVMRADGSNPHPLTATTVSTQAHTGQLLHGSSAGSYSPDGSKIVYASSQSGHLELWVMKADGTDARQLTFPDDPNAPDANAPSWSPDGSKIVFWSGSASESGNVYVMNADGSGRRQLTFAVKGVESSDNPSWLPDGKYIIYDHYDSTAKRVQTWIMDSNGGDQHVLLSDPVGGSRLPIKETTTVWTDNGDTVDATTSAGSSLLIDASGTNPDVASGPVTVLGSSRPTTVWGGKGDSIAGGSGPLQVNDATFAGDETVKGGSGNLSVFSLGKGFSITGSTAGTTFIDDNYGPGGNSTIGGGNGTVTGAGGLAVNTVIIGAPDDTITSGSGTTYIDAINGEQDIIGGAGATTVQAAVGNTITGGTGALQVYLDSDQATTTIDLSAGRAGASLRDVSVAGGKGSAVSVSGFSTATDTIQSKTSVAARNFLGSSKSDGVGGTILTFLDGTTITLAGVTDPSQITFAS